MGLLSFGKKKGTGQPQTTAGRETAPFWEKLTIQECLERMYELRAGEEEKPAHPAEEELRQLQHAVLDKVLHAPMLYVLQDETTGLPFLTDRTAEVYSTRELAEEAVAFYTVQHRNLFVREVPREKTGLPCRVGLFEWFWYLGVGEVLLDNGASSLTLPLKRFCEPPKLPNDKVPLPVVNPRLRSAMIDDLEEERWQVDYEDREDNLAEKRSELREAISEARLLAPVRQKEAGLKLGVNSVGPQKAGALALPRVKNGRQESFLPLFTDWLEFQGAYSRTEWGVVVLTLEEALQAAGDDGIVVNPLTENLILEPEQIQRGRRLKNVK